MPDLLQILKTPTSPLVARLRGMQPFTRRPVPPPAPQEETLDSDTQNEIKSLKEKKIPLRKVLSGLDSLGKGQFADLAKQIYFGLTEPLTKVDVQDGQKSNEKR